MLSDIILFILGEHNDTISGKAELNWHRVRSDLELEISMLGHLLKNICEPYVICNKKEGADGASDSVSLVLDSIDENAFKKVGAILGAIFVPLCPHLSICANNKGLQNWKPLY